MTRSIEIDSDALGRGTIHIDGHSLGKAIAGADIHIEVGSPTTVTLRMPANLLKAAVEGEVRLRAEDAEALATLGWTPPDGPCVCPVMEVNDFRSPPVHMRARDAIACPEHGAALRAARMAARAKPGLPIAGFLPDANDGEAGR